MGLGNSGCLKECQKKAEMQITDENLSFPAAGSRVCLPPVFDFMTILDLSRPSWAGQGAADALCS